MKNRRWAIYLAGACLLGIVGLVLPPLLRRIITEIVGWTGVALTYQRARKMSGPQRRPWQALSAAGALLLIAAIVKVVHGSIVGRTDPYPSPSPADVLYFLGYSALILCVVLLIRLRSAQTESDGGGVDAIIVAASTSVLVWAIVLAPYVRDATVNPSARVLTAMYSLLTLILLGCTTRLAVGPGARTTSYYLLATGMIMFFVLDVAADLANAGRNDLALTDILPPFVYACFAAAALHPDAQRLTEPPTEDTNRLTTRRIVLLGTALLMAPAITVWQVSRTNSPDLPVVLAGWVVLSVLVLVRLTGLVRTKERTAVTEQILRQANATMVSATTRTGMNNGALSAIAQLVGDAPGFRASVAMTADGQFTVVDSVGHLADEAVGAKFRMSELPIRMREALTSRQSVTMREIPAVDLDLSADPQHRTVLLTPLVSQNELRGAVITSSTEALNQSTSQAIEALAYMVSLALESAALTEDLHRQQNERRFRTLIENSSDIVLVISKEGRISFVSPACSHLLGMDESRVLGEDPLTLIHPADRTTVLEMFNRLLDGADNLPAVGTRIRHAEGGYRWFELRGRDLSDAKEIEGVVINAREVTDRKEAEQELARREARFRALVQHSSDIVAVVDDNGIFTYISPAVTEVLGYRPLELEGTNALELLPLEERGVVRRRMSDLARLANQAAGVFPTSSLELRIKNRLGGWRTLDITVTDLRAEVAVGGVVLNARDVTVRKALEHDLRHQALHDSLTGLGNRSMFLHHVTEGLARKDPKMLIATLFIDLDDFKTVNDSLGHAVGDELLTQVAERLSTCLHHNDVAARLGGDEFSILIQTPYGAEEVTKIADRILLALRSPFTVQDRDIALAASIGIAYEEPDCTAELLLRNADMAMYLAKERGKDRYEVFQEDMHASVFERLVLKADLAHGIESGQLRLCYQPIVSLQTGRVTGVEALVRWDHPTRGPLSPAAFVSLAEDTGLIVPLGRWVLEEACRQLRAWQLRLPADATLTMSVNLSVRQLLHDDIVEEIASTIHQFQLDPSTITMELTESMLMVDTELSRRKLAELRTVGVSLAIDDFGTGYSSLGYVQQFPIDIIKIDRSFVEGLSPRSGSKTVVVQTMIEMAQRLGVHIVAEGIEDREQLAVLQALGCDLGQGYYFSEPIEASLVSPLLATSIQDGNRILYRAASGEHASDLHDGDHT